MLEKHIDMKNQKKEKYKELCREKDWRFFGLQDSWIKTFKPQKKRESKL